MGSLTPSLDSSSVLHRSQFVWTDSKYLGDLLWRIPGYHLSELGEVGKFHHLTAYGVDWRSVPLMIDGRPLNDPYTGALNLYDIPLEAIEQVEPLSGSDALLYGGQGSAINLVTRQFNNTRPITNIRYIQGAFEYSLLDGFFAQNIARSTNALLGFQRQVTDGRFANSALDSWHIRGRVRYNASERFNIALTEYYSRSVNGMNGGIDLMQSRDPFDEITAVVRNANASERVSRHDLTLNGIARLFRDSLSTTQFSIYYSDIEREYTDAPRNISDTYGSTMLGGRILQSLRTQTQNFLVGLDVQQSEFKKNSVELLNPINRAALFGKTTFTFFETIAPSIAVRAEQRQSQSRLSYGVGLRVNLGSTIALTSEIATTYRFPTEQEDLGDDPTLSSLHFSDRKQTTKNLALEIALGELGSIEVRGFEKELPEGGRGYFIDSNGRPSPLAPHETMIRGITGLFAFRWWKFEGIASGMFIETKRLSASITNLPKWTLTGEWAYRNVFSTIAEVRAGIRARYASRHRGVQFFPHTWTYGESSGPDIAASSRLDFFTVANIGDAFISLGWENLLNEKYMTVSGYPMPGRTFRFGVNWLFID